MDPVTILGAVGSVVGIAAFGLHLAQFLDKFIDEYSSAAESLEAILEGIESTNEALEQVREFLQQEQRNVKDGGAAQLFSLKALKQVKTTSDKCLKVFWKIEAVILKKTPTEEEIRTKLEQFHLQVKESNGAVVLKLDKELKLNRLGRWKWSFNIGQKLEKYNRQLDRQQSTLILMFQVISLQMNLTRQNPNALHKIHHLYEQIPQTALNSSLPEARRRRQSSYLYPQHPNYPYPNHWPGEIQEPHYASSLHQPQSRRSARRRSPSTARVHHHQVRVSRRRSHSSSSDRGRRRPDYSSMNYGRRHSMSGPDSVDEREAVRRERDRGADAISSDEELQRMRQKIQEAKSILSADKVKGEKEQADKKNTGQGSSRQSVPPQTSATIHGEGSSRVRFTTSPTPIDEADSSPFIPQRDAIPEKETSNVNAKSTPRRPVQYQKPSVSEQPVDSPEEEKKNGPPESAPQPAVFDFEPGTRQTHFDISTPSQGTVHVTSNLTMPIIMSDKDSKITNDSDERQQLSTDATELDAEPVPAVVQRSNSPSFMAYENHSSKQVKSPIILGWKDDYLDEVGHTNDTDTHVTVEMVQPTDSRRISVTSSPALEMNDQDSSDESSPLTTQANERILEEEDGQGTFDTSQTTTAKIGPDVLEILSTTGGDHENWDSGNMLHSQSQDELSVLGFMLWASFFSNKKYDETNDTIEPLAVKKEIASASGNENQNDLQGDPHPIGVTEKNFSDHNPWLLYRTSVKNELDEDQMNINSGFDGTVDARSSSCWEDPGEDKHSLIEDWGFAVLSSGAEKDRNPEPAGESNNGRFLGPVDPRDSSLGRNQSFLWNQQNSALILHPGREFANREQQSGESRPISDEPPSINDQIQDQCERASSVKSKSISRPSVDLVPKKPDLGENNSATTKKSKKRINKPLVVSEPEIIKANTSSGESIVEPPLSSESKRNLNERSPVPPLDLNDVVTERDDNDHLSSSVRSRPISSKQKVRIASGFKGEELEEIIIAPEPDLEDEQDRRIKDLKQADSFAPQKSTRSSSPVLSAVRPWYKRSRSSRTLPSRSDKAVTMTESNSRQSTNTSQYSESVTSSSKFTGSKRRGRMIRSLIALTRRRSEIYDGSISAFVIKGGEWHQIPFNGRFDFGNPNVIRSKGNEWYKQFAFLEPEQLAALKSILEDSDGYEKTLVHLKYLQKSKFQFWSTTGRVLLAVVRNEPVFEKSTNSLDIDGTTELDSTASRTQYDPPVEVKDRNIDVFQFLDPVENEEKPGRDVTGSSTNRELVLYAAYTIRVFDPHNLYGDASAVKPTCKREAFSEADILRRISELDHIGPDVIRKKANLLDSQSEEVETMLNNMPAATLETGYAWTLAQIELHEGPAQGLRLITVYLRKISIHVEQERKQAEDVPTPLSGSGSYAETAPQPGVVKEPPASILRPTPTVTFEDESGPSRVPNTSTRETDGKGSNKVPERQSSDRSAPAAPYYAPSATSDEYPPYGYGYPYGHPYGHPYRNHPHVAPPSPYNAYGGYFSDNQSMYGSPYGTGNYYGQNQYNYPGYYAPSPNHGHHNPFAPMPPAAPEAPYPRPTPSMPSSAPVPPPPPTSNPRVDPSRGQNSEDPFQLVPRQHSYYGQAPSSAFQKAISQDIGSRYDPSYDDRSMIDHYASHDDTHLLPPSRPVSQYGTTWEPNYAIPMQRPHMPYPEFYDGRSYDPRNTSIGDEGDKIVQKLLKEWTPAGGQDTEKTQGKGLDKSEESQGKGKEREIEDSDADDPSDLDELEEDESDIDGNIDNSVYSSEEDRAAGISARSASGRGRTPMMPPRRPSYSVYPPPPPPISSSTPMSVHAHPPRRPSFYGPPSARLQSRFASPPISSNEFGYTKQTASSMEGIKNQPRNMGRSRAQTRADEKRRIEELNQSISEREAVKVPHPPARRPSSYLRPRPSTTASEIPGSSRSEFYESMPPVPPLTVETLKRAARPSLSRRSSASRSTVASPPTGVPGRGYGRGGSSSMTDRYTASEPPRSSMGTSSRRPGRSSMSARNELESFDEEDDLLLEGEIAEREWKRAKAKFSDYYY